MISTQMAYLLTFGVLAGIATGMLWVTLHGFVRKWYVGKSYATMWGFAFAGAPMAQWLLAEVVKGTMKGGEADAWRASMKIWRHHLRPAGSSRSLWPKEVRKTKT
jgi:hypothetical protein